MICFILLLAFSDFSALAQAGCRADDLMSSSYNMIKSISLNFNLVLHVKIAVQVFPR